MGVSPSDIRLEAGNRIFAARKSVGINQAELAERLDMSRAAVANIEVGRQNISLVRVFEIAAALDVPVVSLIPTGDAKYRREARRERQRQAIKDLEDKLARARRAFEQNTG